MTRYRKLKQSPIRVKKGSVYGGFAGLCVLLMLSCAFAGFAANAKGMDLATEDSKNWRAKDVFILPSGIQGWYIRKPVQTDAGLEVPFNQAATGEYTVYVHNTWAGDLTGMTLKVSFLIKWDSSTPLPVFEARLPDSEVQVRLHFQTTAGSWEPQDLWWSELDYTVLTSYDYDSVTGLATNPSTASSVLNSVITYVVPMTGDHWSNYYGTLGSVDKDAFDVAIADVQEIGFSFGRSGSLASGVALSSGDATFILTSYVIQEA